MPGNFNSHREKPIYVSRAVPDINRTRIPVLDGFRGIAVLLVMCYHFVPAIFFGWAGVDLFFILSGFLITSILMNTIGTRNYLSVYFSRRLLRIVPLFFLVLLFLFVLLPVFFPAWVTTAYKNLVDHQYWYWLFIANSSFALNGFPENIIAVHFWSLACEMQFYLVWPVLIVLLHRRRNLLLIILLLLFFSAIFFRLFADEFFTMNNLFRYVLLPSRLDAFAAGGILYLYTTSGFTIRKNFMYFASVLVLLLIMILSWQGVNWHFTDPVVQRYGLSLNVVFWLSVLALSLQHPTGMLARVAGTGILRKAGTYSYGMYVLHLPVGIFIDKLLFPNAAGQENGMMLLLRVLLIFSVTIIISIASFHLFEKKMMLLKPRYHVADH